MTLISALKHSRLAACMQRDSSLTLFRVSGREYLHMCRRIPTPERNSVCFLLVRGSSVSLLNSNTDPGGAGIEGLLSPPSFSKHLNSSKNLWILTGWVNLMVLSALSTLQPTYYFSSPRSLQSQRLVKSLTACKTDCLSPQRQQSLTHRMNNTILSFTNL